MHIWVCGMSTSHMPQDSFSIDSPIFKFYLSTISNKHAKEHYQINLFHL